MPTLKEFRTYHYDVTVKVSENTRAFALAAIAIVWIFKVQSGEQFFIPLALKWPLFLSLLALCADFLQHLVRSIIWYRIFRNKESELEKKLITEDEELFESNSVNLPAYIFYYLKIILLFAAYILLIYFFVSVVIWV